MLELVLMLYRKRHHLGDYIHLFLGQNTWGPTFLEFPPVLPGIHLIFPSFPATLSKLTCHPKPPGESSSQKSWFPAMTKRFPPGPTGADLNQAPKSRKVCSAWPMCRQVGEITREQLSTLGGKMGENNMQHAWIFISFNEFLMWF